MKITRAIAGSEYLVALMLVLLIIAFRTFLHIAPNIEIVTAAAITTGCLFKNKYLAFAVPMVSLLVTDLLLGNTLIFIFTWSGFLFPVFAGIIQRRLRLQDALYAEVAGTVSTLFFFFWTNLGVVLTTHMYSKDLNGLLNSYFNAIPFLKNQLLGNLIFVPLIFLGAGLLLKAQAQIRISDKELIPLSGHN